MSEFREEIVLVLLGAFIGLVSSLVILVAERWLNQKGKLFIYYRISYQKGINSKKSWGFFEDYNGEYSFIIPVVYEIQNTSNTTKVVRDVGLYLYNDTDLISKMTQLDQIHITTRKGKEITCEKDVYFGAEKGSYSFVIEPRSINRFECEYIFKSSIKEIDVHAFNKIVLHYYDERNRCKKFFIRDVNECWRIKDYQADEEWILAKKLKDRKFFSLDIF